jgi:uncharacterized iron-regulated membrane protein
MDAQTGMAVKATDRPTKRRPLAFLLHSLFGLNLSLLLGFVCLTGSIATVSHELEWLTQPALRATATAGSPQYGAMWDAARRAYPDAELTSIAPYDRNGARYFVWAASAYDQRGDPFFILIDPGTNRVTGTMPEANFHFIVRALHYYLFVPGALAFYAIGSLGFVLLTSLITGLLAYKKFWRSFFRMPRWGRGARTLLGDLHRLTGLWSIWFAAVIALTTIWYVVEHAGVEWEQPVVFSAAPSSLDRDDGAAIDRWAAAARRAMPGLAITSITLPAADGDAIVVQGHWRAWLVRERTNAVYLDPANAVVIARREAGAMQPTERFVHTADPLHFGNFGGLVSKLVWVTFGLTLTALAGSGAYIFAKRTRLAIGPAWRLGWFDYLGHWKWPSLAVVSAVPLIAYWFIW